MIQVRVRPMSSLFCAAALACACCLAGCAGPGKGTARLEFDPMIGGRPVPDKAELAGSKEKARSGDDDPLLMPSGDSSNSPAALAVVGERTERKEEKEGVKVGTPRVDAPAKLTQTSADAPAKPTEGSYEQLQQQLEAKGVVWQNLKKLPGERGEWVFACSIPDPVRKSEERHYEAKAAGAYGLAAIKAVLADIEDEQKARRQ